MMHNSSFTRTKVQKKYMLLKNNAFEMNSVVEYFAVSLLFNFSYLSPKLSWSFSWSGLSSPATTEARVAPKIYGQEKKSYRGVAVLSNQP